MVTGATSAAADTPVMARLVGCERCDMSCWSPLAGERRFPKIATRQKRRRSGAGAKRGHERPGGGGLRSRDQNRAPYLDAGEGRTNDDARNLEPHGGALGEHRQEGKGDRGGRVRWSCRGAARRVDSGGDDELCRSAASRGVQAPLPWVQVPPPDPAARNATPLPVRLGASPATLRVLDGFGPTAALTEERAVSPWSRRGQGPGGRTTRGRSAAPCTPATPKASGPAQEARSVTMRGERQSTKSRDAQRHQERRRKEALEKLQKERGRRRDLAIKMARAHQSEFLAVSRVGSGGGVFRAPSVACGGTIPGFRGTSGSL